jgi:hypothetical protein
MSAQGEVAQIEQALLELWDNYSVQPSFMGASIANLRNMEASDKLGPMRADIKAVIESAEKLGLDDSTMVMWGLRGAWIEFENGDRIEA